MVPFRFQICIVIIYLYKVKCEKQTVLVISTLIALIKFMVTKLRSYGLAVAGVYEEMTGNEEKGIYLYQVPCEKQIALVISPLIALIKVMVTKLRSYGLAVTGVYEDMTENEEKGIYLYQVT